MRRITSLAAAILAAATLAACGAAADTAPDVTSPGQGAPADGTDTDAPDTDAPDTDAPDTDAPDTTDPDAGDDADDQDAASDWRVFPEGQELALEIDGHVTVLATLPDEGESVFRSAAVRPGGTATDFTVVVVTSAEGMFDLRWLTVIDGEAGELELFDEAYNLDPGADASVYGDRAPAVAWSPDGTSLAFAQAGDDGAVLRTIGWSDAPGTGETATDNAAFGLEAVPNDAVVHAWVDGADERTIVELIAGDGASYEVQLDRQADGAWAIAGDTGAA